MEHFDLTPDTKVLIALTRTPMQPLDSLCELIDNSIDSFQLASLQGCKIDHPLISIDLPRPSELYTRDSVIKVTDNGPGLTSEMAEKALRAGFSGNNSYDSLGLFGLGFNISTGKLGRITRFFTVREDENKALEVIIDLEKIRQSKSYKVMPRQIDKPTGFNHGTVIEISGWWPDGDPNGGFVRKLIQYGLPTIRSEIGRRYATILREGNIRILINGEACRPFEHCVWDDTRYVERREHGQIPAVFRFNKLIGTQKRCVLCTALVEEGNECPECKSSNLRTIEERIRGWVGIQRFDDPTDYGIDLVRNGRTIRIAEKAAFFEYVDEFKRTIKDYPIDGPYGRIVGEVHLNHVPVDFLKQDFQRSSPEWQRAIAFLRGDSSLQPTQPNADKNNSYVYKLYQGYRKVRLCGKTDMYMGYWNSDTNKPSRISRDTEKEYYLKFEQKLPGYYDDTEWWKLVEQADKKPLEELIECPNPECSAQNLKERDVCDVCGYILKGKSCINPDCGEVIPQSSKSCPHCGISQIPEIEEPWICQVCESRNIPASEVCFNCGQARGIENTMSIDYLMKNSNKDDTLSIPGCSVVLADGSYSPAIDVNAYVTSCTIKSNRKDNPIPLSVFKGESIEIFIDKGHRVFKTFRVRPEQLIATEVALYIYDSNRRLSARQYQGYHTLSNIQWEILNTRWADVLEDSPERIRDDIQNFFNTLRVKLPEILKGIASDFFDDLTEEQKKSLVNNMISQGKDISKLGLMKQSGSYLLYVDEEAIVNIFKHVPEMFFDGGFWNIPYIKISHISDDIKEQIQLRIREIHRNCMEDIVSFVKYRNPEIVISQRARTSLEFLQQKVVELDVH